MKMVLAAVAAVVLVAAAGVALGSWLKPAPQNEWVVAGTRQWVASTEIYIVNQRTGAACVLEFGSTPETKDVTRCQR